MKRLVALLALVLALMPAASARLHGASPLVIVDGVSIGFSGNCAFGVFDASIADTPAATRAWMSYSCVDVSPLFPGVTPRVVNTRAAYSDDAGATWHDAGVIVNPVTEGVRGGHDYSWINEVSTLLYDATAPSGARWKLFWQHYPIIDGVLSGATGWTGYKEASSPTGLVGATEKKLFTGSLYDPANNVAGGTTDSPVGGAPLVPLSGIGLSYCLASTEPGGTAVNASAIYMVWNCEELAAGKIFSETDLVACLQPCTPTDPANWALRGVPTTVLDDVYFGTFHLSGQDIFFDGNIAYLLVGPVGSAPVAGAYQGCFLFQFTNLATGAILRNADGKPHILNQIQGAYGTFNGACTYGQHVTAAGFLYGEITTFVPDPLFDIFVTGRR